MSRSAQPLPKNIQIFAGIVLTVVGMNIKREVFSHMNWETVANDCGSTLTEATLHLSFLQHGHAINALRSSMRP